MRGLSESGAKVIAFPGIGNYVAPVSRSLTETLTGGGMWALRP